MTGTNSPTVLTVVPLTTMHEPASSETSPGTATAPRWVLPFAEVDRGSLPLVGGKGANLGEMTRAGFPVPPGFCVTTAAYRDFLAASGAAEEIFASLDSLDIANLESVHGVGERIRAQLTSSPMPEALAGAIVAAWEESGRSASYAVRSSATAEDLPQASFAGQQDTYLNVRGKEMLLESVRRCWASLFTDRAIVYRAKNGFDHRGVLLSVVVQHLVVPEISGILFTADPITGHRQILSIDASYGLGEALVSGLVSADLYQVDKRRHQIIRKQIAPKTLAIVPRPDGGTVQEEVPAHLRESQALPDSQILQLAALGERIERHYGRPQDVEWCLAEGVPWIVQSRPITSLFPVPSPAPVDGGLHAYISFNHIQVMTDPMPPLARTVLALVIPFGKSKVPSETSPYLASAGGRLYIDLTRLLRLSGPRRLVPKVLANADALMAQALIEVTGRAEFRDGPRPRPTFLLGILAGWLAPISLRMLGYLWLWRPERQASLLACRLTALVDESKRELQAEPPGLPRLKRGRWLLGTSLYRAIFTIVPGVFAGVVSFFLVRGLCRRWLGDDRDATLLARGLEGNVTSEMGLALGDLADEARAFPAVIAHLETADPSLVLDTLAGVDGGRLFLAELRTFLDQYGMRGAAEIDLSRPRWNDDPSLLVRALLNHVRNEERGGHRRRHAAMAAEAEAAGRRLVAAVSATRFGGFKARLLRRLVSVCRGLFATREHPKFFLIRMFGLFREVIRDEARTLHERGVLERPDDVWFLELPELLRAVEGGGDWKHLIAERRAEHRRFQDLTPPRVLTSDGEAVIARPPHGELSPNALRGSPVSAGVVEGPARVALDPRHAALAKGEILVAPCTDPGWTPLFLNAAGLVMEVGGLMTHGSVVAREYGIPAVVGIPDATKLIRTGQRIRVNGDLGYVELLEPIADAPPGQRT